MCANGHIAAWPIIPASLGETSQMLTTAEWIEEIVCFDKGLGYPIKGFGRFGSTRSSLGLESQPQDDDPSIPFHLWHLLALLEVPPHPNHLWESSGGS